MGVALAAPGVNQLHDVQTSQFNYHTPDFGHGAKVFSLGEPVQAEVQGDGGAVSNCWKIQ